MLTLGQENQIFKVNSFKKLVDKLNELFNTNLDSKDFCELNVSWNDDGSCSFDNGYVNVDFEVCSRYLDCHTPIRVIDLYRI